MESTRKVWVWVQEKVIDRFEKKVCHDDGEIEEVWELVKEKVTNVTIEVVCIRGRKDVKAGMYGLMRYGSFHQSRGIYKHRLVSRVVKEKLSDLVSYVRLDDAKREAFGTEARVDSCQTFLRKRVASAI